MKKVIRLASLIISDILKLVVVNMPGPSGIRLRQFYYRKKFKAMGDRVVIDVGVQIDGVEKISLGNDVHIDKGCIIATGSFLPPLLKRLPNTSFDGEIGEIIFGNNIHICQFGIIMGYGGVKISDNFVMSAGSKIYSLTNTAYDLDDRSSVISLMPYSQAPHLLSPVVLDVNVWLGLHTIVMPAVTVGSNSFCASNSVVTASLPPNSYAAGQPASVVRNRFETTEGET